MAGLDPRLFGQPALNRRLIAPPALSTDLFRKSITDTEEEKEKSPLDYLEFLQAGEYLTAGITHSIVANEDLLKSIQEKHTFSELINEAFPEAPKAARVVAGFAASVVLDPLTYVGIGALTKAGKAAKVSGTLAATRAAQARAGQRALLKFAGTDIGIGGEVAAQVFEKGGKAFTAAGKLPGVGKVTNSFKNAFVTGHKLKGVKGGEIVQGEIDKFRVSLSKAYARAQEGDANILSLVPDKGRRLQLQRMYEDLEILSDEDLTKFIGQMSADPEAAALQMADIAHKAGMDKLTANEVSAIQATYDRLGDLETGLLSRNLLTVEAVEKFGERLIRYFPHVKPGGGKFSNIEEIRKAASKELNLLKRTNPKDLRRKRVLDGIIEDIEEKTGKIVFEKDIAKAVGAKEMQVAYVTTAYDMVEQVIKKGDGIYTKPLKEIELKGGVKRFADPDEGYVSFGTDVDKTGLFNGIQMRKEVADELKGWTRTFSGKSENQVETFLQKFYDPLQDVWKSYTLAWFPAYHFRNALSNVHNNTIVGIWNPQRYVDAGKLQRGKKLVVEAPDGTKYNQAKIKSLMEEDGVLRRGSFIIGADKEEGAIRAMRQGNTLNLLSRKAVDNKAINFAFGIGERIENNAKIANYIDGLAIGLSPKQAAMRVKKVLFDYGDLTAFEKKVMKRIFPFYTWTRKNIPLQIEAIARKPGRGAVIPKVRDALEESNDNKPSARFMGDFLKNSFGVKVRKDANGNDEFFVLRNWLPSADILELLAPHDLAGQMTSPLLKAPAQWASNYNFFFKNKIEKLPGELGEFLGLSLRKKTIDALKNIRLLNELDRTNPFNVFGKERALRTELSGKDRFLSFATGLKLYGQDEQKAMMYYIIKLKGEIRERKYALKKAQAKGFRPEYDRLLKEIEELEREGVQASKEITQRRSN